MIAFSKFGNIHKRGATIDEYNVIRTKYVANVGFKSFEVPSVPLQFNMDGSNPNIGKSLDIALEIKPLKCIFSLEYDETFAGRGWNTYKLFMKVFDTNDGAGGLEGRPKYVQVQVLTECPCLLTKQPCYDGPYTLLEMTSSSPVEVFTHKHNCKIQQIPGIMTVKFTLIDISRASLTPLEILKLKAKRNCDETLEPIIRECEKTAPDVTIVCKEGEILAPKMILMARAPALRSMFQTIPQRLYNKEFSMFAIKVILHFIYTGTLQEDWTHDIHGVINAAKHYQLHELTEFFEHYLIKTCNKNNAFTTYQVAAKYSMKHSLKYALETILMDTYLFSISVGELK